MTATIALLLWPVIAVVLFLRLPLRWAVCATIMGGFLLLPGQTGFNLPMLPTIEKNSIAVLSALVLTAIVLANRSPKSEADVLPGWIPRHPVILGLLAVLFLATIGTNLTNRDAQVFGPVVLPGLRLYDLASAFQTTLMGLLPFILARRLFASEEGHRTLLFALVIAACAYSLPTLFEVRMSPQLNVMIYGFFPHDFAQHFRAGGWRPVVFLSHGLVLGIFFCCAFLTAAGLSRTVPAEKRFMLLGVALWLFATLFLTKTIGAFMIALVLLPVAFLLSKRMQLIAVAGIVIVILSYPTLRYADLVPTERLLSLAGKIDPARQASLGARFKHEDMLLDRAKERPLFGWGGWGRSRVLDQDGRDISVTDGRWVITYGLGGWSRYLAEYGLMTLPVLMLAFMRRRYDPGPVTVVVAIVLAANLIDAIPNSAVTPITWMLAGALAGRLELARVSAAQQPEQDTVKEAGPGYRRPRAAVYGRTGYAGAVAADLEGPAREGPRLTRFATKKGSRT